MNLDISKKKAVATALVLGLLLQFFGLNQVHASAESGVLSYQTWKTKKIEEARSAVEKLQQDKPSSFIKSGPVDRAPEGRIEHSVMRTQFYQKTPQFNQKIQQAQQILEVAQELTVSDYLVLYLHQFKSREVYLEVAKKLSADEIADLMMAFEKHLSGSKEIGVITSAGRF